MTKRYDRRMFLCRAAAAGLVAPTFPILGCGSEETPRADEEAIVDGPSITRPVLLPWSADVVHISSPIPELPMAYVSRGLQRVFVDHEFRGRVNVMLAAHISVSSGLWRIPLVGDDLGVPIPADDALREFEEVDIGEWDPGMDPVEGDFRVRRGRRGNVKVDFDCAPMSGRDEWFSAGPWDIAQCEEPGEEACLEAFLSVGTGTRYTRRYCTEPGGTVRFVTWACPEL